MLLLGLIHGRQTASFPFFLFVFFFNDTATTEIYTLSLHDALPIWCVCVTGLSGGAVAIWSGSRCEVCDCEVLSCDGLSVQCGDFCVIDEVRTCDSGGMACGSACSCTDCDVTAC